MKRLMIDMDNCITDALFIERINEFLGTDYKLNDQTEYRLQKLTGKRVREFWNFMKNKSFYDGVSLIDGAYDTIKVLNERFDLYIITAFIYPESDPDISGDNLRYKYNYLKEKLPFISPTQYVFTENKDLIKSDIAIDDRISHLQNADTKILFDAWHNRNISDEYLKEKGVVRVSSWKEILDLLEIK